MGKKIVPYETIVKALQQDESAIVEILLHYKDFIKKLAGREIVNFFIGAKTVSELLSQKSAKLP